MKRQIEMILVDVDDCLLPTNGQVSSEFFEGLGNIALYIGEANEGWKPTLGWCSGRDRNYIEAVSFFAGLPNSWSIIESGIALFNPTTKEMLFNPALTLGVQAAFAEIRRERLPQILKRFPDLFDYPGNMINIALERQYGINTPIEEYHGVVKKELADLEKQNLVTIHHSRIAVDISPPGIDKASGVQFLSQRTGIKPKQMLGIGDSKGDFPMMKLVGSVGCPANASAECIELVNEKSGYVSSLNHAAGVVDVINHFTMPRH